jgi:hypothetical protein
MDPGLQRALRCLEDAAASVKDYRFELSDDYLSLIGEVEAMPRNQSGADRSGRWLGSRAHARRLAESARLLTVEQ